MKIGVLGGTFDPVHNGHLYMAKHCIKMLELDKIMFLPNGNPPHKREQKVTDKSHRYKMLCIAIEGEENFYVSDYEINREDYSYTVETMRYMRKSSDDEYVIIIGADSFYQLHLWYDFPNLIKENSFVVLDREYMGRSDLENDVMKFNEQYSSCVKVCRMPMVDVSSTIIRDNLSLGIDVSGMVPDRVFEYIADNKLYR